MIVGIKIINMKIKSPKEKRDKKAYLKAKNSIRAIWKVPKKEKKGPTGEFKMFLDIAEKKARDENTYPCVIAKHITIKGIVTEKWIHMDNLTPTNFSHIKPKGMNEDLRLDPNNVEIVSRAYHEFYWTKRLSKLDYFN